MSQPLRPAEPNPHWIMYDVYGDAMRDSDPLDWTANPPSGWTVPVLASQAGASNSPMAAAYGFSASLEQEVADSISDNWWGAKDLMESPWFASVEYHMKRRFQLPAVSAVVNLRVIPLIGFMGPLSPSHPVVAAAIWARAKWDELSEGKRKKIKHVAPVSAEAWNKLARAIIEVVEENAEMISVENRTKLMKVAEIALAAMDTCVTLAETISNNTGLRPVMVATWDAYRQVNIIVGLGDPGDAQGALGGDKDLSGEHGPWLLRNMKWIAPLALLAAGGIYVAPIVAPLLRTAMSARSRASRETRRLEARAKPLLEADQRERSA